MTWPRLYINSVQTEWNQNPDILTPEPVLFPLIHDTFKSSMLEEIEKVPTFYE